MNQPKHHPRPWERKRFAEQDVDPLSGFANLMDVMLVFALGLMVALISQSQSLQQHFGLETVSVTTSEELIEMPESMQGSGTDQNGMESVGKVYRDARTGKLILIGN